jgi:AcrR family transcriptional regulator
MTATAPAQRSRILDAALGLMSERGAGDTSMRALANACGLNVATLYHYFPSKADLLRSVIEERGYFHLLATEGPPIDQEASLHDLLVGLLDFLWAAASAEEAPMRLLLGESLRGDPTAAATVSDLLGAIDTAMARWLRASFSDLPGDPAVTGRIVRRLLVARLVEDLAVGPAPRRRADRWAEEVAEVLAPR